MIELRDVHKTLGGRAVLRGVDLRIEEGEALALVGPSGTGKSVLLRHIVGLLEPDRGDVVVGGRSLAHARFRELADIRARMAYVFQEGGLLDSLTVFENLLLALGDRIPRAEIPAARRRMEAALSAVNLDETVLQQLPGELSGGMRRRVGVARAIINEPRVILYDEPTTGLDPRNADAIHDLIRDTHQRLGATSVIVTHDLARVGTIADRVALLERGQVHFTGTPDELFASGDGRITEFLGHESPEAPWRDMRAASIR